MAGGGNDRTLHHPFNHVIEVTGGQDPDSLNTTCTSQFKICTKSYDCQEYLKKTRVPKRKKEAICLVFLILKIEQTVVPSEGPLRAAFVYI